jgi:hypothetical protein
MEKFIPPVPMGVYSHFKKGAQYIVFDYAFDSDDNIDKIIYRRLDGSGKPKYVKSVKTFTANVEEHPENDTGQEIRFELMALGIPS